MAKAICSIKGCERPRSTRGWCEMHYTRWKRTGSPGEVEARRGSHAPGQTCSIVGCDEPARTKGWCKRHYCRWWTWGDTESRRAASLEERLDRYTDRAGECWVWSGHLDVAGYGKVIQTKGQPLVPAHRASYEFHIGPIPDGLVLDHLCRNRACVNPAHLEPVTHLENVRRGNGPRLSEEKAAEVKRLLLDGWGRSDIGEAFGVSGWSIWSIAAGRSWADVEPERKPA